ncbi:armadillo-type protein [Flagelloscypha sp. PMI_526]|nr:armadillo-type protein [Flagelloscypha sp. PMI_526]
MFKSMLSSKRIASSDFTMVTTLSDESGKENSQPNMGSHPAKLSKPATGLGKGHYRKQTADLQSLKRAPEEVSDIEMNFAFDQLLDDLQIPATLRPKLVGMDSTVKAAMIKSSQTLGPKLSDSPPLQVQTELPTTPRSLRRPRSIDSINALPAPSGFSSGYNPYSKLQSSAQHADLLDGNSTTYSSHQRGTSFDTSRLFSRSQLNLSANQSTLTLVTKGNGKDKHMLSAKSQTPTKMVSVLQGTSSLQLDIENVKKLRLLLRNESASWTSDFLNLGGYNALMCRLNEILEVEWREEQHDDQVLHELLRCFKALDTSAVGCAALRSASPTPYDKLVSLLYSDKKPGEVGTRQLITELLLGLFDLYKPTIMPTASPRRSDSFSGRPGSPWAEPSEATCVYLPAPHRSLFSFIRALLLIPAPPTAEAPAAPLEPHEFIESLHRPRIYKTYLQELSDVCRDYFWVFCHPNNTVWILSETDESKVEKPRAPGGMTGGVEFEAMSYFATHFRFLNAVAKAAAEFNRPKEDELSAYQFHQDLFLSGFERILLIARKASTTYYPTLHLEIARYVQSANDAGFELPWTVQRLVGKPPTQLCKYPESRTPSAPSTPRRRGNRTPSSTPHKSRQPPPSPSETSSSRPPMLPSPMKMDSFRV